MFRTFITAIILMAVVVGVRAQVNTSGDPRVDAVNFVTNAVEMFNQSTVRFQALRLALDDMHPLAPASLDTNALFENLQSLTHFQRFLEAFRQQNKVLIHRIDDSVGMLEARLGDTTRWKLIDRFYKTFKEQSSVYVQYSINCSNYVMAVRSALVTLQTNGFDIVGGAVQLRGTPDERDRFTVLTNKLQGAHTAMQEAYQLTLDDTKISNALVTEIVEQLGK